MLTLAIYPAGHGTPEKKKPGSYQDPAAERGKGVLKFRLLMFDFNIRI